LIANLENIMMKRITTHVLHVMKGIIGTLIKRNVIKALLGTLEF